MYIYLIKRKKKDLKKNSDVENCGASRGFGYIYIYILVGEITLFPPVVYPKNTLSTD